MQIIRKLAVSAAVLVLAASLVPQDDPRSGGGLEETVVVYGKRPHEVRSGVIEIRVEDRAGDFLEGLTAADFRINDGRVEIVAAAEVHFEPALLVLFDDTMQGAEEREVHTALLRELAQRFPAGVTAVGFLEDSGVEEGRFLHEGERADQKRAWIDNTDLLDLLSDRPARLYPTPSGRLEMGEDKHLIETLQWLTGRFQEIGRPGLRNFLVTITDGYQGDPRFNWQMSCVPNTGCKPFLRGEAREQELRLQSALARRRVHPVAVLRRPGSSVMLDLWGNPGAPRVPSLAEAAGSAWGEEEENRESSLRESGGWPEEVWQETNLDSLGEQLRDTVAKDRARLTGLFEKSEGFVHTPKDETPADMARILARQVKDRLSYYWIAWRTPDEERRGERFLDLEVERPGKARVEPDRIGPDMLLDRDPWIVLHFGDLDEMGWVQRATLFPEEGVRTTVLAMRMRKVLGGEIDWIDTGMCPFVLPVDEAIRERVESNLPTLLRSVGLPPGEKELEVPDRLDLCRLTRSLIAES